MKQTLLLALLFFTNVGFSQLTISNVSSLKAAQGGDRVNVKLDITNNSATDAEFFWDITRTDTQDDWGFSVCDVNLGYSEGRETCPSSKANILEPNASYTFSVYIHPNATCGIGNVMFSLRSESDGQGNVLTETGLDINVACASVSKSESDHGDMILFPNPTSDLFQINSDVKIEGLRIYNIVGKLMIEESHVPGQLHNVSDLDAGVYLVRLTDENNKIISVLRLTKN